MIEIKNLSKDFLIGQNKIEVLKDISFNVTDGEFVSIVGKSGSGKSTLVNIISGLINPTEGLIKYNYKNLFDLKQKELNKFRRDTIGFVFQDFNLEKNETVYENVIMPTIFAGHLNRKKRAIEVLDKVGLKDKLNNKVYTLSGGEKQRVAIARALINNPKIIIADEPTGNLDYDNGIEILNLLKTLSKNGYTVIMITHNIEHAKESDRIIKLKKGKIEKIYNKDEIDDILLNNERQEEVIELENLENDLNTFFNLIEKEDFFKFLEEKIINKKDISLNKIKSIIKDESIKIKEEIKENEDN